MSKLPEDLIPDDMDHIQDERARMFTRQFWGQLLKGQEGLGDTFWAGNYLAGLLFLPLVVFLLFIPPLYALIGPAFVVFGLYLLVVARAVAVARAKGDTGIGWRIFGVLWTLMNAGMCLSYAPFSAGG